MDYQKEYAILVGQVDRAISILECCVHQDPLSRSAGQILSMGYIMADLYFDTYAECANFGVRNMTIYIL